MAPSTPLPPPRPAAFAVSLALSCAACASTATPDRDAAVFLSDADVAIPADTAVAVPVDVVVVPADAPSDVPLGWHVRVLLGPGLPLVPGVGFAVRVENAAGQVLERTTGADGVVPLGVARSEGPWDVTVARAGCRAVSILSVEDDFDGDVYSECAPESPFPLDHFHTLFVGVEGVADLSRGPTLCLPSYIQGDTPDRVRAGFTYRPGVPPVDVWAVEFEPRDSGLHPLNIARLLAVPLFDRDVSAVVRMPTVRVPVLRSHVAVQFPTEGFLTGRDAADARGYESVTRTVRFDTQRLPCSVGRATWTPPDASGRGAFELETFAPPYEPSAASIPLGLSVPSAAIVGGLSVRTFTDGAVVHVAPVRGLRADAESPTVVRLTADAPGYGAAFFRAYPNVGNVHGLWVGHLARGSALNGRRLPRLPSTVSLADLTFGLAQDNRFRVEACVASRRAGVRPLWTPDPEEPEISLCSTAATPMTD